MIETDAAPTFRDAEPADADWIAGLLSDEGYPAGASDIVRRLERFAEMGSLVRSQSTTESDSGSSPSTWSRASSTTTTSPG